MRIFKTIAVISLFCLFAGSSVSWAMSEEQYAQMAAQNIVLINDAQGDPKIIAEKSKEFLEQFSEEQKQDYITMAHRVMQDKALAQRISQKIVNVLVQMGYKVMIGPEGDIKSISVAQPGR